MPLSPSQINEHLTRWKPLVVGLAMKFRGKLGVAHDLDDIIAIGMVELWRAAQTFDESNAAGAKFSTYASRCVLYRYLAEAKALSAHSRRVAYHSRQSLTEEDRDGKPVFKPCAEGPDPEQALLQQRTEQALASARGRLPSRLQQVVHLRFHRDIDLKAIGAGMGISRERARQLEAKAIERLRVHMRAELAP